MCIRDRYVSGSGKERVYLNPVFYVTSVEREPLDLINNLMGCGEVRKCGILHRWEVRRKEDVIALTEYLSGKLKTKVKCQQFERWKRKVLEWKSRGRS